MSTPTLVIDFYERIWNSGDANALPELLSLEFAFRGSLGAELTGLTAFWEYVCGVRNALNQYRCDILECVTESSCAFARMRFSGIHVGDFRGYAPTGLAVSWEGAALFRIEYMRIRELWVLGDLAGLEAVLKSNARADAENRVRMQQQDAPAGAMPRMAELAKRDDP
jgi:predicted ester cyclase